MLSLPCSVSTGVILNSSIQNYKNLQTYRHIFVSPIALGRFSNGSFYLQGCECVFERVDYLLLLLSRQLWKHW